MCSKRRAEWLEQICKTHIAQEFATNLSAMPLTTSAPSSAGSICTRNGRFPNGVFTTRTITSAISTTSAFLQSVHPVDPGGTGGISVTAFSNSPPSSSTPMLLGTDHVSVTVSALSATSPTVTIKNISSTAIDGPFQIVSDSLTPNVTVSGATGTFGGWSYATVAGVDDLNPGQSALLTVHLTNPGNLTVSFDPLVYSGEMD
jgi:hypothetical protein